jgi:hypothetical protein
MYLIIHVFLLNLKFFKTHYTKIKTNKFYKAWVEDLSDVTDILREKLILKVDITDLVQMPSLDFTTEEPRKLTGALSHIASIWSPMSKSKLLLRLSRLAESPSTSILLLRCPKMTSTSE